MNSFILFATFDSAAQAHAELTEKTSETWMNGDPVVAVFGAVLVALIVVGWAVFFRKPNRTVAITPEEAAAGFTSSKNNRRRKQNRYPTLAETGGLPPVRSKS